MENMFYNCGKLSILNVSNFNTGAVASSITRFAYNCGALTQIILGANFGQSTNIPTPGSSNGMFYVGTSTNTTVTGANTVMQNYNWAADNRTLI